MLPSTHTAVAFSKMVRWGALFGATVVGGWYSRGGRAVRTSGRECVARGRGSGVAGRAVRPGAEHGRPEVRLISGASA